MRKGRSSYPTETVLTATAGGGMVVGPIANRKGRFGGSRASFGKRQRVSLSLLSPGNPSEEVEPLTFCR